MILAAVIAVSQLCSNWYASPPQTDAPCVVDGVAIYLAAAPEPACAPGKMVEGASIESMVVALHELAARAKEKGADTVHLSQYDRRERGDRGAKWTARGRALVCGGKR